MDVRVDRAGRNEQAVAGDRPGPGTDRQVDAVHDVRVAGPSDTHDAAVLDADVGLDDPDQGIDDDRATDHGVELALGRRAAVLAHPRPEVLRVAPENLIGRIGRSEVLVTVSLMRARSGASRTSPSANRTAPGPSSERGPNGARITTRREPSSSRTSKRISCATSATPSSTWFGATATRPAWRTSSYEAPPRAAACISSQTSAIASGAFNRSPRASVRRASSAAEKIRSRSSSVGVRRTAAD